MRKHVIWTAASAAAAVGVWQSNCLNTWNANLLVPEARAEAVALSRIDYQASVPSREQQLQKLASGTLSNPHDVLIIGGGATGTGCAVDAVTRYKPRQNCFRGSSIFGSGELPWYLGACALR